MRLIWNTTVWMSDRLVLIPSVARSRKYTVLVSDGGANVVSTAVAPLTVPTTVSSGLAITTRSGSLAASSTPELLVWIHLYDRLCGPRFSSAELPFTGHTEPVRASVSSSVAPKVTGDRVVLTPPRMVCVAALVRVAAGEELAVWVVRTTMRNVWSVERPSVTVNCNGTWVLAGTFR